ncbi:MAG: enoyl-CoA hydratase/isomerase family protein [Cumulibacter sp.]
MSETELIGYDIIDRVAVLRMQKAPVNALDDRMLDALHDAYRRADADPGVGAIIVTSGVEKVFCGGMDLKWALSADVLDMRAFIRKLYIGTMDVQYHLSKPTIAAVNAPARGAGITLSITCDMVVAAQEATLGYPEINVGFIAAIHNAHLPQIIGRAKAFELLVGGEPISAAEAERMGLINYAVPSDRLLEKALDLGRLMAGKSPQLMNLARSAFVRQNDLDYRRSVENQIEALCTTFASADSKEAIAAFVEKRAPRWT